MRRMVLTMLIVGLMGQSCTEQESNPLVGEFQTPYEVPPFNLIAVEDLMPAFEVGTQMQNQEVDAIVSNPVAPSFENTVEALEHSGTILEKVSRVFFNLTSAHTNDLLQEIAKQVAPLLSKHDDDIRLNPDLFERVKAVYDQRLTLTLDPEQQTLLEETYKSFVRGGALLEETEKARLREINEELSLLSVQFGENVLEETNSFELVIESKDDLVGLPGSVVAGAAEAAEERGYAGKFVFTLHKPSMIPFLQFSGKRELREKIFKAYINRGSRDNEFNNEKIVARTVRLRAQRSELLGYKNHSAYVLEKSTAKTPEAVYDLLGRLWEPSLKMAKKEALGLQELIDSEGESFQLEPWDWWYYAEKLRTKKYGLDEASLRPYFQLEDVRDGAFEVARRLYGLAFEELTNLPKYHEDVRTFEVKEADGSHVGILYLDYFPRASKKAGAWMNSYRKASRTADAKVSPVISNVCNFSKPVGNQPALLSLEEVRTLFHEFGHALHGLLSKCTYDSLSGTAVPRDFVELPSQIMENWATHPEVLKIYARHYESGEVIPQSLLDKIGAAKKFNQGFATVEYLAASFLDMDWHTLSEDSEVEVAQFESGSLNRIGLIPEIVVRYKSPYFSHVFSGGYASGYYSYIWAEVLDADAFQAFKETSLFDLDLASSFRENILAKGGSEEPMELYKRFRGAEPQIDALLERKGLN